ncbi:Eco57I restriction-modification methylase domain-containing protein [Leptospira bouyouniensis]|uniref:site-specific DNA-methyltransferase (adenine-specific) n=1 Tax=Leptospira bouyouniensis TaxID=2484911 RepID=A0ABY2KZ93_9LEPT|nr:DNA methyltransferase [Leptospira bouyouniensis]TGK45909.1 hypothetical protein EHQ10_18570 [Leptospira bouyouniensis]
MLNSSDRSKLKSKVSKLKNLLIEKFTDYTNTRYFLQISKDKRIKELLEKQPIGFQEWHLIEKKLESTGMSIDEYIIERSYTYLNRTFFLMRLEILGIQKYPVFRGMKDSTGWKEFKLFCPNLCNEADEGYLFLTRQVSDFYARELPGLFLDDSADRAIGIPRELIYELFLEWNDPNLESIFEDDTTAGWIYQYWNDPDREAINKRVKDAGEIEGKEIASATQLFTERYMVEWLIQNSLGNLWLSICAKNKWKTTALTAIENLQKRRVSHNKKIREKQISDDTALLIETPEEEYWKYYLERVLTNEEIESSIASIRDVKVLDPACGSGHFLLYAFYFLLYLYREEDRIISALDSNHMPLSDVEIAKSILENNLHGIDLDPRAVQIAVASLYTTALKVGRFSLDNLNLVATRPSIGSGTNKETFTIFIDQFSIETNISKVMAEALIDHLGKSDVLGSLMQIRSEIKNLLETYTLEQGSEEAIFQKLEDFVKSHDIGNDLGLFTMGNQLSRGLRLLRLLDQKYDVVVANPPYLSLSKINETIAEDYKNTYSGDVDDLYQAFFYAYQGFAKRNGYISCVTMHGWMYISQFKDFRVNFIKTTSIDSVAHLGTNAFEEIKGEVTAVALYSYRNIRLQNQHKSIFIRDLKSLSKTKKIIFSTSLQNAYTSLTNPSLLKSKEAP